MDKKSLIFRGLLIACVVLIIVAVIFVLIRKEDRPDVVVSKPINESVELADVFSKIRLIEGMVNLEESLSGEVISDEQMAGADDADEDEIDFGKYDVLEKMAIVNTTDDSVNEVWMVKLGSYEQQEDVCRILGNRLKKLKAGFEDDKEQMAVLNQAVIKQEDGIVIMIVSPHFREVQETVAEAMSN